MSERHPAHAIVRDMENDVADVARWGQVLLSLGNTEQDVAKEAIYVIGDTLHMLGKRLDDRWKAAFAAGGGRP